MTCRESLMRMPQCCHPDAGHQVEILAAVGIV